MLRHWFANAYCYHIMLAIHLGIWFRYASVVDPSKYTKSVLIHLEQIESTQLYGDELSFISVVSSIAKLNYTSLDRSKLKMKRSLGVSNRVEKTKMSNSRSKKICFSQRPFEKVYNPRFFERLLEKLVFWAPADRPHFRLVEHALPIIHLFFRTAIGKCCKCHS